MATSNLRRQHDAAIAIIDEIRKATAAYRGEPDAFALSLKLARLVGILRIHFAQEDKHLYPAMLQSSNAEARNLAETYVAEMGSLGPVFDNFAARWNSSTRIAENFTDFHEESEGIFVGLARRIERENNILYPLADRISGAGLRAA